MKNNTVILTIRTKRTNGLVLTMEFIGPGCRKDAESAAMAILRANPDRYVVTLL